MSNPVDLSSICYKRNFLSEVIARVDLVSPLPGIMQELPKPIGKAALTHFPIDEPKPAFVQELLLTENELAIRKHEFTEWNFYGRNREKRLTFTPQFFFVTYKEYRAYEQLREEFLSIVEAFLEHFDEAQPSRLGLRYKNELDVQGTDPLDWRDHVSDDLLALFSYKTEGAMLSRVFHNLEVVFDDFSLRFQFGVHNPDYPAPIRRRAFILDYDAYYKGLLEPQDIPVALDAYHTAIQNTFERSITDSLREVMDDTE